MIAKSKTILRKELLAARNSLSEAERKEKSEIIRNRLFSLEEFKNAKTIAFYLSKGSEVETFGMIETALKQGKKILVPVMHSKVVVSATIDHFDDGSFCIVDEVKEDVLELVEFTSFDDLVAGRFGVPEPKTKIVADHQPDTVIIPGLAFDLDLHRLGYGKGYYDRALKKIPIAVRIGICFDLQIVEKIPRHEHDERLHVTLSEKRVLRI